MYSIDTHGAWLGPAADGLTEEQRERFAAECDEIIARYPRPDDQDERTAALTACVQYLLGETSVADAGAERARTQRAALDALAAAAKQIIDTYDEQSTALFATARLWDDGLIDPRDSRRVVGLCLDVCKEADERRLRPNSFGVARM